MVAIQGLRLGLRPVIDGERVYAASHDGDVFSFDPKNGRTLWRASTKLALSGGPGVWLADACSSGSIEGDVVALERRGRQANSGGYRSAAKC